MRVRHTGGVPHGATGSSPMPHFNSPSSLGCGGYITIPTLKAQP